MAVQNETPPASIIESPLTPPPKDEKRLSAVSQAVDLLRRHCDGFRPGPWVVLPLSPGDYAEVLCVLEVDKALKDYVEDKVRYDYNPRLSNLIIRMPTTLRETFCAKLVREILSQLESIQRSDGPAAQFAEDIEHLASSQIELPEDNTQGENAAYSRWEPDAMFGHVQAQYPGVIVEVCYLQKRRQIPYLADEYILNTDGSVNIVVFFDIEYKGLKKATVSIWRPQYITRGNGVMEFCATAVMKEQVGF